MRPYRSNGFSARPESSDGSGEAMESVLGVIMPAEPLAETPGTAPTDAEMTPTEPVADTPGTMTLGEPTWPRANLPRVAKPSIGYPYLYAPSGADSLVAACQGPSLCKTVARGAIMANYSTQLHPTVEPAEVSGRAKEPLLL